MLVFLFVAALSFLLSGAATLLSRAYLLERVSFLGSFAGLERSLNAGIAFGVRLPMFQTTITILALLAVIVLAWRGRSSRYQQAAFGLVVGGALANLADRLADGYVTDYIQIGSFPVFNVADSCITVGVLLLLGEGLLKGKE